jgi:hypothetical protein
MLDLGCYGAMQQKSSIRGNCTFMRRTWVSNQLATLTLDCMLKPEGQFDKSETYSQVVVADVRLKHRLDNVLCSHNTSKWREKQQLILRWHSAGTAGPAGALAPGGHSGQEGSTAAQDSHSPLESLLNLRVAWPAQASKITV